MALEIALVKGALGSGKTQLLKKIAQQMKGQGVSCYFVSFCPFRRKEIEEWRLEVIIINPWKSFAFSEEQGVLWLDEWPSFIGEHFRETFYALLSFQGVKVLSQSYSWKKAEHWLKKEILSNVCNEVWLNLPCPPFPVVSQKKLVIELSFSNPKVCLIKSVLQWPTRPSDVFLLPNLDVHSCLYALGRRHRVKLAWGQAPFGWRVLKAWLLGRASSTLPP